MPSLSLYDLANLVTGDPEAGTVNSGALHTLLHALLKNFNIQHIKADVNEVGSHFYKQSEDRKNKGKLPSSYHHMDMKIQGLEREMSALDNSPVEPQLSNLEEEQRMLDCPGGYTRQIATLKRKIEENERSVSEAISQFQHLLHEINLLKDTVMIVDQNLEKLIDCAPLEVLDSVGQRLSLLEQQGTEKEAMELLERRVNKLEERLASISDPGQLARPFNIQSAKTPEFTVSKEPVPHPRTHGTLWNNSLQSSQKVSLLGQHEDQLYGMNTGSMQPALFSSIQTCAPSKSSSPDAPLALQYACTSSSYNHYEKVRPKIRHQNHRRSSVSADVKSQHGNVDGHALIPKTKSSLKGKVSDTPLDSTTMHLNTMVKNVLGKELGQVQDWRNLLEYINVEIGKRLDRMKRDSFRKGLEKCWKTIYKQLQARSPQYEGDEATVIRKQLGNRFKPPSS